MDTVVLCEHTPVFTVGRRDSSADWISDPGTIAGEGIEVVKTDRGGRITYHGPGQLVVYFIFNINERKLGIKDFVHKVEDVCMASLKRFGIDAARSEGYPGLWVKDGKIVALGFHVANGVTMHGIAVNVDPDMSHFRHIVPCGIRDRGVVSMRHILGRAPGMNEVIEAFRSEILKVFG